MRSLLDVNVVIALLAPDHVFHERAHPWWADHHDAGWASCPVTVNGVVRVMSNDRYGERGGFRPAVLIDRLSTFARASDHQFWPDDVSLRDATVFAASDGPLLAGVGDRPCWTARHVRYGDCPIRGARRDAPEPRRAVATSHSS